jgi:capsular polysaccharide biosynthesis protein
MKQDGIKTNSGGNPRLKLNRAARFARKVRSGLKRRFDLVVRKTGKKKALSLDLVDDHKEFGGFVAHASIEGRHTDLSSPLLYDQGLEIIRQPGIKAAVPDLFLLELDDVEVIGSTNAVVRGGKILHPELLHTEALHDSKAPDLYRFTDASRRKINFDTFTRLGGRRRVKVGIHLLKEHSFNYYHWLFECLPRLNYLIANIGKLGRHDKFTVLIDGDILPGAIEAMRCLIRFPHDIEIVRRGERVSCDRLFYVSPFWFSLDNSRHQVDAYRDYAVDRFAVQTTRDSFQGLASRGAPTRKIFLPRVASQVRRITNAAEVEGLMRESGFEVVHAHEFSFAGQVELFSSAKVLIGASGAAFSNMVFMQPGTKAVIFSPKQLEVFNYYIFQQLADVAGVELAHLLAVPAKKDDFYIHDNFSVNIGDLKTLVKKITA